MVATSVAAIIVLWAPFVGEILGWIRSTFPGHLTQIVGGIVAGAIVTALGLALLRIRDRHASRYGAIAAAVIFGVAYAVAFRTGDPSVDAVERFHFVEYGFVTCLFFRAWQPLGDLTVFLLPALAGLIVGTFDELVQWFIPVRVGELHDIFLNGAAIASGLLFAAGVEPLPRFHAVIQRASLGRLARMIAAFILVLAAFVSAVHLGHEIHDDEAGTFRSRYTAQELRDLARDRAGRWRGQMIPVPRALSREDQYISEALWHVQRRNVKADALDTSGAWGENRILETFFAPVIDTPSYLSPTGLRWPPEQRANAAARAASEPRLYVSDAEVYPLYLWPQELFWGVVVLLVGTVLTAGKVLGTGL